MDERQGAILVSLARAAVELFLREGNLLKPGDEPVLQQKRGVFVSIYEYPVRELRGCIGFPYPQMPLGEATVKAAVAAAVEDPRFPPLNYTELAKVVFEVSVLTQPEEIDAASRKDLPRKIRVGVDGLIIETPHGSGLLLPQVPVEYGWDAEEYLCHLCVKAGLNPTYWLHGRMRLLRYSAEVFAEQTPGGKVSRTDLV
ncbi:MAG: TIGR00296 family protein [Candidatus Caldarchaeum sp.]|uniref:Protein ENM11_04730 n=1 Tax=Caldiarchaeum subterraneum TaxID=311458 RepID=A0A7C5L7F4_CALS0